jgi:hypothetical protein
MGLQVLWVRPVAQKLLDLLQETDLKDYLMHKMRLFEG